MYVSLEPCRHVGKTPPCTHALIDAGIARVIVGTADPSQHGGGAGELEARGIAVQIADDAEARELIETFAPPQSDRPYVALKMAMSLDGAIAAKPGVQEWITSEAERLFVRDLRIAYDAVMVGAGTVRVDDPQLTVRPPHHRLRPYVRVVVCETESVPLSSRILAPQAEYGKSVVVAPAALRDRLKAHEAIADVLYIGSANEPALDLSAAMRALRAHGIFSVLCEGGPTLAARLVAAQLVDRFYWAIAPVLLRNDRAVNVFNGTDLARSRVRPNFERIERCGEDLVISGTFARV